MNRPDRQPLDLDTIEAAYREVMNDDTEPISSAVLDVFCDIPALIAEVKRLRGLRELDQSVCHCDCDEIPPTPQPDPLDENDHRDRLRSDGLRLARHRASHWHTRGHWCEGYCGDDFSLHMWNKDHGPLTFADTPQPPPEATSATQAAPERLGLLRIAQAAHRPSETIYDWLDLKEHQ